jgi:inner membrane protein involved in colicin E2 resistance
LHPRGLTPCPAPAGIGPSPAPRSGHDSSPEGNLLLRQLAALVFIFVCTSIAWMILGGTLSMRTDRSKEQLQGRVASTWGAAQEQQPPIVTYKKSEFVNSRVRENGKIVTRMEKVERDVAVPLDATQANVHLDLSHRQKGLLWYSTYAVDFRADYQFQNPRDQPLIFSVRMPFPAQKAVYDGLLMQLNGQTLPVATDETSAYTQATVSPGQPVTLHLGYRSQGIGSWRYKLADGVAQVRNFSLSMHTNFKDIDFADDTLSPTAKKSTSSGWDLTWHYSNLISGFQIGMTMPEKLQPGPLASQISFAAPVSLFFFFFLMFMITTLRNIDLHPMNYFFLAAAFFAFHLLLAYLVDHISIHAAMAIASLVSIGLVVSYLRLVIGIRFAAIEAGAAQLIYLVLYSYAFFWKGYTGLSITVISVLTLFVIMQATGKIRWSEKFAGDLRGAATTLG